MRRSNQVSTFRREILRTGMMRAAILCTISCASLVTVSSSSRAQEGMPMLPGAIPAIDAGNYPSIQAALDAVPPTGGLVRLPPGIFPITESLRMHTGDTTLAGSGTATQIVNLNENGQPAILVSHPECVNPQNDRDHELWRIRVENLRVTGNTKSGAGIEARRINEIFLDGVTISEHGDDGIFLNHCYEDPRITDCLITYNQAVGVNLQGCHDIIVSACQFEENQDALHCFDGFNLCMTGCCLDDHLRDGVVIENTYGSVVSGNMIEECDGTAIILDRDCYGITLSANVIAHNGGGVDLADAHGCTVSANTFTIVRTDAVRIGNGSGRITVTGNNFSNSYIGGGRVRRDADDQSAGGLVLLSTEDIAVSGNVFAGLSDKAITLVGESQRVVFANNVLSQVRSDHTRLELGTVVNNEFQESGN